MVYVFLAFWWASWAVLFGAPLWLVLLAAAGLALKNSVANSLVLLDPREPWSVGEWVGSLVVVALWGTNALAPLWCWMAS